MKAVMEQSGSLKKLFTKFNDKTYAPLMGANNAVALKKFIKTRYREEEQRDGEGM